MAPRIWCHGNQHQRHVSQNGRVMQVIHQGEHLEKGHHDRQARDTSPAMSGAMRAITLSLDVVCYSTSAPGRNQSIPLSRSIFICTESWSGTLLMLKAASRTYPRMCWIQISRSNSIHVCDGCRSTRAHWTIHCKAQIQILNQLTEVPDYNNAPPMHDGLSV